MISAIRALGCVGKEKLPKRTGLPKNRLSGCKRNTFATVAIFCVELLDILISRIFNSP